MGYLHEIKGFNPCDFFEQSKRKDRAPAYEPKLKENGEVEVLADGHIVYEPSFHLPAKVILEWFLRENPDARVVSERLTEEIKVLNGGEIFYPPEVAKVSIYKNAADEKPAAVGYGKQNVVKDEVYDALPTAITKAYKNALTLLGYGIDLGNAMLKKVAEASLYKDVSLDPQKPLYVPLTEEDNKSMQSDSEPKAKATKETVKSEKKVKVEKEPEKEPEKEEVTTKDVAEEPAICEPEKTTSEETETLEDLFEEKDTTKEAEKDDDSEMSLDAIFAQSAPEDTPTDITSQLVEEALDMKFAVNEGVEGHLLKKVGMTFREIKETDPGFLEVIGSPSKTTKEKVPSEVLDAAKVVLDAK